MLRPVLESVKKEKQDWQEGLHKIMSKVATLRENENHLYLDDPRNFRPSVRNKSSLNFVTDCNTVSNKRLRRNLSPGQHGCQPRQGQQSHFDYLVQKDFLDQENSDNRIRANRLQKLNALCAQSSKRIEFLKSQADDYLSRATTQNEAVYSQSSLHRNFKQSLTTKNGVDAETPIDYVNQGIHKLFQNHDIEEPTKLLARNQRVQSAMANGRAQSNDDLRRRIQSAVGSRGGERRFKNLITPQLNSVQGQTNQDVELINQCIEKRLQKVDAANLNSDLIKNVVSEALQALQQSRRRADNKTTQLQTLGSNLHLQRVQSDKNKSSDPGERKSLGSNVSFSEKPLSQQTKQSVVKALMINEGQRESSEEFTSLNEAKMLDQLKKEKLKQMKDHPFLKQTKIRKNAEELKPVGRMALITRQAPSQDSKNATKTMLTMFNKDAEFFKRQKEFQKKKRQTPKRTPKPEEQKQHEEPASPSKQKSGRSPLSPKQRRGSGVSISINIGDKSDFKESLRKSNHRPNRLKMIKDYVKESDTNVEIVPEDFENMISYYRSEASLKEDIVTAWEGEQNPNFRYVADKDPKPMFNASGKSVWLNERDYYDKKVLKNCKSPLDQARAELGVVSSEDYLAPVTITRAKNIVAQNFEERAGFGLFGNWYGHACIISDDFPASLAVRDPRITKSTPNLFQDMKEGQEVALESLQKVAKQNDKMVRRAQDDCDQYRWQNIHISSRKEFNGPMLKEVYQHSVDYALLETRLLSEEGTLCNIQNLELQLVEEFKNETQEQEREIEAMTGFQMPILLSLQQISNPDYDFTALVYTMEEEFVKLERDIDPVKSAFADHLEDLDKLTQVGQQEMRRLKQQSDLYRMGFDVKSVSRAFNREDGMSPVQLRWLLDMDKKLYAAMSNIFYSPFRPAPILQNMMVEFNIFKIHCFEGYLKQLYGGNLITKLDYQFPPSRKKFLKQALVHFNEVVVRRGDQQMKLACYVQKQDYQRQDKLDRLESKHVAFTAERLSRTYEEIQQYKVESGISSLESHESESRMQLYIQHDLSSVLLRLSRNRYPKVASYQMLKLMDYAVRMGVTSIDSDYYEEFGKNSKLEEQFSIPIFQQLRPVQFRADARSLSNYFEHQCGFRFEEPNHFFDIFVPIRNKNKQSDVQTKVESLPAPTVKKMASNKQIDSKTHAKKPTEEITRNNKEKKKITNNNRKKTPQKFNKDLAELHLFEAFTGKHDKILAQGLQDENSKFTIEAGTIMDALLSDSEEEKSPTADHSKSKKPTQSRPSSKGLFF